MSETPETPVDSDWNTRPSPEQPHRKKRRGLVWILLLLIIGAAFYFAWHYQGGAQTAARNRQGLAAPVTITAAIAKKGNIGVYLDAIGTVTPVYTSSITAQVNGIVTSVNYTEGQMVQKGDSLIEINPGIYQAQLVEAQGTLQHDTQLLAQAQMDLERYRQAWARNAVQRQTLEDQEKLVLQLEGTVKFDQGAVQLAEVQVGYCHITAPITGRVGLRLIDPGNLVQAYQTSTTGSPLVVVTQIQPITVVFTIAEDSIGEVQPAMRKSAALTVDAYDRTQAVKIATGRLLTLDNQVDTTTGTVKLRAIFQNKNQELFPNQFVNARLLVRTLTGVTLIPTNAIQHNGQEAFVYVIRNGVAWIQTIKPGTADSGMTEVVQGLKPGDVLATSSFEKLRNNATVVISNLNGSHGL
jgi:membrane fusion protein, multidrug efflux system